MRRKAYPQTRRNMKCCLRNGDTAFSLSDGGFHLAKKFSNWPVPGLDETRLRASLPLELHLYIPPEAPGRC
jgi:hypothetical protein